MKGLLYQFQFSLFFVLCLLLSCHCSTKSDIIKLPAYSINEAEAIRRAEEFIAFNGYTDLHPTDDSTKITYETLEYAANYSELMKLRHNTLERKAYGILKATEGWVIIFRYKNDMGDHTARVVTMSFTGKKLRVQHQDINLHTQPFKLFEQ